MAATLNQQLRAYAMLGVTMALWAGNSIVGRAIRAEIPPLTLAFCRWTLALAILAPFALPNVVAQRALVCRHWRSILILGISGVAAFNALLYSGLQFTTASNGLLVQGLIPALVAIVSRILFKDRTPARQWTGIVISTLGVFFIVFEGDLSHMLDLRLGIGDLLVLLGCGAWAVYTACLRLRPPLEPLALLFVTFFIGALVMAAAASSEVEAIRQMRWTGDVIGAIVYVGIFPSIIAYLLFNTAVGSLGASTAGQTISLMPLFGAILASLLLDEPLLWYHGVGMALILAGVVLGWRRVSAALPRDG